VRVAFCSEACVRIFSAAKKKPDGSEGSLNTGRKRGGGKEGIGSEFFKGSGSKISGDINSGDFSVSGSKIGVDRGASSSLAERVSSELSE